mmetsp:Transcript_40732/g.77790  ORF Transcript_40732/g.77790 Transcript_40732/m.77790 type:complete len:227 (-) Transcript_40732:382-1062(-)
MCTGNDYISFVINTVPDNVRAPYVPLRLPGSCVPNLHCSVPAPAHEHVGGLVVVPQRAHVAAVAHEHGRARQPGDVASSLQRLVRAHLCNLSVCGGVVDSDQRIAASCRHAGSAGVGCQREQTAVLLHHRAAQERVGSGVPRAQGAVGGCEEQNVPGLEILRGAESHRRHLRRQAVLPLGARRPVHRLSRGGAVHAHAAVAASDSQEAPIRGVSHAHRFHPTIHAK